MIYIDSRVSVVQHNIFGGKHFSRRTVFPMHLSKSMIISAPRYSILWRKLRRGVVGTLFSKLFAVREEDFAGVKWPLCI